MQAQATSDKSINDIKALLGKGDKLDGKDIDVMDFTRIIAKMPNKHKRE